MRNASRARGLVSGSGALGAALAVLFATALGWAGSPRGPSEARIMAEVDGEVITAETVEQAVGQRLHRLKQEIYQLEHQKLDELIKEKLLQREAARRGLSVQRLIATEIKAKVRVSDQEVEAFYREHKDSVKAPEAAVKEAFRRYLEQEREAELMSRLVENLRSRARVRVYLEAPTPIRPDDLTVPGAPFRGPKDAPVTIVVFWDAQCPFCAKAQAVLQQVLETYPNEVKLVFRHFPLERHAHAKLAAEAAECAARQGKFWEYYAQLHADATRLSLEGLRVLAQELGLDLRAFATCLDTGKARGRVVKDLADGREAGVTGTPTFFINGRIVEGAQPFATFERLIDRELVLRGLPRGAPRR